ncbi:hypothetical protein BC829DRAFT_418267 [Chytridium lagenaria]|nr:hypothetical protein BC829DRAFT_418267 [Chytridium lagenaria]
MIKAEVLNSSHGPGEEREDNAESKDKRRTRLSYKATGTIPVVKFHFGGDVTSNTITETETHRHHSPPPPLPAKQRSNQSKSEPPATLPVKAPKKSKKRVTEAHAEPDDDAFVFRKKKKSRKGVETSSDEVVATDNAQVSSSPKEEAAKAEDNAKNTDEGKKLEEVKKAEEVTTTVRLTKGKGKAQIDAVQPEHVEEEISKDADLKTKPVLQDKNVQEKITPDREDPEKYATISQADILPHLNVRVGSKDLDIILKTVFKVLSQRKKQKVVFSDLRKEVLHELAAAAE